MALDTVGFEPYCIIRRLQQWSPCAEPSFFCLLFGLLIALSGKLAATSQAGRQNRFDTVFQGVRAGVGAFCALIDAIVEVFMKRVLSRMLVASGLLLGASALSTTSFAAEGAAGPVKPDAAKGGQLFDQGDAARGIIACASCHGAAGNSTIPVNPNLAAQSHEYLAKQLADFQIKPGAKLPVRNGAGGNPTPMTAMAQNLTPADMQNIALYLAQQPLKEPATAGQEKLVDLGQKIWRGGLPDRKVPACASCHSANARAFPASTPGCRASSPCTLKSS